MLLDIAVNQNMKVRDAFPVELQNGDVFRRFSELPAKICPKLVKYGTQIAHLILDFREL
jgi:uncharacterized Zn ribbon protein